MILELNITTVAQWNLQCK